MRLFNNGRIFTSADGDSTLHNALVTDGDKVVFVGSNDEAARRAGNDADVTNLRGDVVLPGIIDGHIHLVHFGRALTKVECLGKSAKEIQEAMKAARAANPDAKLILGKSFLYDALGEKPHRSILDEAVSDIPVIIDSMDLHSSWVNTAALKAMGLTRDTPDPKGGEFVRDDNGELSGHLLETAHFDNTWPFVASLTSVEDRLQMLDDAFEALLASGITGGIEMALTTEDLEALEAYYKRDGSLPLRISAHWLMMPEGDDESRAEQVRKVARHRDRLASMAPWLRVVGIKIISDGVVDSCTAYLKDPYPNGANPGPIWPGDELSKVVVLADSLDMQIAVHALGDAASEQALDAFEDAIAANGPRESRKHRIEHLEVVTKESIARLARLGVTASLQPVHADPLYAQNWWEQLGSDARCDRGFPWSEFVDAKAKIAFGSDAPVAPHDPLPNIYTAGTRQSSVNPKLEPSTDPRIKALERFCVKLEDSIRYYTAGCAQSIRSEDEVGTLEPGKSADFCILNIDPFRDGVESLKEAQKAVRETWVAGKQVFKA